MRWEIIWIILVFTLGGRYLWAAWLMCFRPERALEVIRRRWSKQFALEVSVTDDAKFRKKIRLFGIYRFILTAVLFTAGGVMAYLECQR